METGTLTARLKQEARRLGFDLVGACPALPSPGIDRFRAWLAEGYAGQMRYLADRAEAYEHPRHVLDGVRSVLMLAVNYRTVEPAPLGTELGRASRFAWGSDYHDLIHARLHELAASLRAMVPQARVRGVVDTAPLLEREFAQLAGLGWIGKNTLLLNRRLGSWFFLAALLTDQTLEYDEPTVANHCGTCRACLEACPTGALVDAYRLDARRCISYLTIELRVSIPGQLRAGVGQWLFGCDACQDVCPWNRRAPPADEEDFRPLAGMNPVGLIEVLSLDEADFRKRFRQTPLWRAKRRGLLRNAAIVLGNQRCATALPALRQALRDVEPLVRGAAAWALGQIAVPATRAALRESLAGEEDAEVRAEIEASLA